MTGKNHVVVSSGLVLSIIGLCGALLPSLSNIVSVNFNFSLDDIVALFYPASIRTKSLAVCIGWSISLFAFLAVGAMFPDIDNKKSLMGRYLHVPFKHRTWTHSIWAVLLLFPMLYVSAAARMFWIGYVAHVLEDIPSAGGICLLYPFQRYREYPSGARVACGHKLKLYYTAKPSENWFVLFSCMIFVILCVYFGIVLGGFRLWFDTVRI